jgi:hypothetical protein
VQKGDKAVRRAKNADCGALASWDDLARGRAPRAATPRRARAPKATCSGVTLGQAASGEAKALARGRAREDASSAARAPQNAA